MKREYFDRVNSDVILDENNHLNKNYNDYGDEDGDCE